MIKTPAYIDSDNTREFLLIHEEDEVNRENAKAVFTPEFIPYRLNVKEKFDLSHIETLIYGFIRFYKSSSNNRFYFTNEQIAKVVGCSQSNTEKGVATLIKKGILKVEYRIKGGGGKIRFVQSILVENGGIDLQKTASLNHQELQGNKNKIKDNKIEGEGENIRTSLLVLNDNLLNQIANDYEVPVAFVRDCKENMELWLGAKGRRYKDYSMALRNWVKKDKYKVMYDAKRLQKGVYANSRGIDATQL